MKRVLSNDEQQAEVLISQWAEWVRHENRAIAGGYGSMFKDISNGGFEEQLPSWVCINDVLEVNKTYLRYATPVKRAVIAMAWSIDRKSLERCRETQGGIKTRHQAAHLKISVSSYNRCLSGFRAAVVGQFVA